jgi:hypothetical protein
MGQGRRRVGAAVEEEREGIAVDEDSVDTAAVVAAADPFPCPFPNSLPSRVQQSPTKPAYSLHQPPDPCPAPAPALPPAPASLPLLAQPADTPWAARTSASSAHPRRW